MTASTVSAPPSSTAGYVVPPTPSWSYFGMSPMGDELEDVPELRWPNSMRTYHRMRTDAQIDALISSVIMPLLKLRWTINPNGAAEETVDDISQQFHLPIKGNNDDFVLRGRNRFNHRDHMRMALLAPTVYGFMMFEQVGDIMPSPDLRWILRGLEPRMPQTISKISVATNGDLQSITQYDMTNYKGKPIPISQLAPYTWQREGGNWLGRSMLRPLFRHYLLKDRLLRIDAIKNERFGAGIPVGEAPQGGDPAQYARLAQSIRATESGGVGVPSGGKIGIQGITGVLPDTLASIMYQDEAMARSFLAMFMQLGQTQSGSRALGESFVNFFVDALAAFANWYADTTNRFVIEDIVDWNHGSDENAPLLEWEETDEEPLSLDDLANLVYRGALVVDAELENWIRDKIGAPAYEGAAPLPTKPGTAVQEGDAPAVQAGGKPSKGTSKDKRLKENKGKVTRAHLGDAHDQATHGNRVDREDEPAAPATQARVTFLARRGCDGRRVEAASQTLNNDTVGHRQPTAIEAAAATDFAQLQAEWEGATSALVAAWGPIRTQQIDALVADVQAAVEAGDSDALASLAAPVLGGDIIEQHMTTAASAAIAAAKQEAKAQGAAVPGVAVADMTDSLKARSGALAALLARGLGDSAARNALLRYGAEDASADAVAAGVRTQLEGLTDSYLNDVLGGAVTQAQNGGRRLVMGAGDPVRIYSSELLDENTCEACADVDGTEYASMGDADQDYPAGGYAECLGGPRCRGTLVGVYGES